MKYCTKCGNELKSKDLYCSKCGTKVEKEIKESDKLKVGDNINIRLSKGKINAKVEGIE